MLCRLYAPPPPLGHFVELLWLYQGFRPAHDKERLLPTGTVELVIHLREDKIKTYDKKNPDLAHNYSGTLLCGAHSEFFIIDTESQDSVMGAHFRPGGAFPLFRLPGGELHNLHAGLDCIWQPFRARELRERILEAPTADGKIRVLELALLETVRESSRRHPAVAMALTEFDNAPGRQIIREVTEKTGLSARRFIDLFEKEVGLTPKLYCRVQRFQKVLRLIQKTQEIDWTEVALSCGYYDQSHFIHDFRAFSGINPTAYLLDHTEHLNHVPLKT